MIYTPPEKILEAYADVLVNFALNSGKGINAGDVVLLQVPECAKPLLVHLRRTVLKSGGHPLVHFIPDDMARDFYELANEDQLKFFPGKFLKGRVDQADHSIAIIAETNKKELEGIDPKRIMLAAKSMKKYKDWRDKKEYGGKFTWTLALYGTPAMAKEANIKLKEYWQQIVKACFLDEQFPVSKWRETYDEIERVKNKLNSLKIKTLRIQAKNTDLIIGLGKKRQWVGGSGRNIPSFELFTSPDFRQTEGKIHFNQPLYRYGNLIDDVDLIFKKGKVVSVKARKGQKVLEEMIKQKNADMIGEFSLTDGRFSRITKFMAETLFDENRGGKYGNTHIALGSSYKDCYDSDPKKVKKNEWKKLGFNDSVVHTDIVSTLDRIVTAELEDRSKKVIYKSGKFTI